MASAIHEIEGLKVIHASSVHDYVQLALTGGISMSIYNPFQLSSGSTSFSDLQGKTVAFARADNEAMTLTFIDGAELKIDLRYEAYSGPEAVVMYGPGRRIIVWN